MAPMSRLRGDDRLDYLHVPDWCVYHPKDGDFAATEHLR